MKLYFEYRAASSLLRLGLRALRHLPVITPIALLLFFSSDAVARLNGDASLVYSTYEGSANLTRPGQRSSFSSSSLTQDYTLMYSSGGSIYNQRVGTYDVALGYNLSSFDSTFNSSASQSENIKDTHGRLMYMGEVKINPKELPFKFNAYSRDMNKNLVLSSDGGNQPDFMSAIGGLGQPTIINDSLRIESGATLIAGVKNGMTNGYNELLRHFPMLLIDFKDSINRDYRSYNPTDDRLTRLAFVSLNKKDNWFHYRHLKYQDNIDASNNYEENQIQLGSVDQFLDRRWIDFSNWIRVSTDMLIIKRKTVDRANPTEEVDLNLFVTAERKKWSAQIFSSYVRYVAEDKNLSYQLALPVYVSGVVNQDMSWNTRFSYRDNLDRTISGTSSNFTNMLAGYSLDAYKRAPFVLSQGVNIESASTYTSDALTLSGNIGTSSSKRFSNTVTLSGSYRISNTTTSSSNGSSSDFLLQKLDLRGAYAPTKTFRFDIKQSNLFTRGNSVYIEDTTRDSHTPLYSNSDQDGITADLIGSKSYQSNSTLSATWSPKPRLKVRFSLSEKIRKSELLPVSNATEFNSNISFSNQSLSANNSLSYFRDNSNNSSISDVASLSYIYSRSLNANVSATYSIGDSNIGRSESVSLSQGLNYSYFTTNGKNRVLFDINESMTRTVGSPKSLYPTSNAFTLGLRYYPISRLTLASGLRYSSGASVNNYSLAWHASASANFKLLQASVDYTSGLRTSDKLRENKLTGTIRKSF